MLSKQVRCSLQGVLGQAKNGDELFWQEKFHVANGKAQTYIQGALFFFLLSFGGRGNNFFHFSLVRNLFTLRSLQVPNVFPNMFSITPHFYPICFDNCCPPFTYIGGPKGMNYILQYRTFYFGEPSQFHFKLSDGPIKLAAPCKKNK